MKSALNQIETNWYARARREAARGNSAKAIEYLERAATEEPENLAILLDLGNAYAGAGATARAVEAYGKILKIAPDSGHAWTNLGNIFSNLGDQGSALACYEHAVRLLPDQAIVRYGIGRTLSLTGKAAMAIEHLSRACEIDPNRADAWLALGKTHQHLGHYDAAMQCFDRALEVSPGLAEAKVDRAVILLNQGNFREGWREYEHRWEMPAFGVYKKRSFGKPQWKGEALEGKRILLHTEQGFGDAIQFARFIPAVRARGAEVFLELRSPLAGLLSPLVEPEHAIVAGEPLPEFDYHCSLMSLAAALDLDIETIPATPYLTGPSRMIEEASAFLNQADGGRTKLRAGLVWRGNPSHCWNGIRSVTPQQLAPFAAIEGIQWYSLQKDATEQELASWPKAFPIATLPKEHLQGFERTAAITQALDLVISIDTVQAHLTGALGKPLWLLLPLHYEWRWHSHLAHSPWYPSARLFRQHEPGNWTGAIERLAKELTAQVHRLSGKFSL